MTSSAGDVPRRRLLQGSVVVALSAIVGCDASTRSTGRTTGRHLTGSPGGGTPTVTSASPGSPTTTATNRPDWAGLARGLAGSLLRPGDGAYLSAKLLFNPRFDASHPLAVVRAAHTADVVETIDFARRYGLAVRPRSGGHSYVGASSANKAIQLDTRQLSGARYDAASRSVVVEGGTTLFDVHTALDAVGRTIPTGTCASVGAAGLTLGGGFGVEDRAYGLTCDAVESVTLVTADGRMVEADRSRDRDLFWGCRGGGGGNFGVLTEMRLGTFPADPMSFFYVRWADADTEAVLAGWQRRARVMPRSAWGNLHLDAAAGTGVTPAVFGVSLAGSAEEEANALVAAVGRAPLARTTYTRSHHDGVLLLAGCSSRDDGQCHLPPKGTLGREISIAGSDVLERPLSSVERHAVARLLRARASQGHGASAIFDPLGGVAAAPGAQATAFPWRAALGTVQWYVGLPTVPGPATTSATYGWIQEAHRAVRSASSGAYVNYLEPGRAISTYYGVNYAGLRRLRRKYDPDGLFRGPYVIPR